MTVLGLCPLWPWRWVGGWCPLEGGKPGPLCWKPAGPWVLGPQNKAQDITSFGSPAGGEGVIVPSLCLSLGQPLARVGGGGGGHSGGVGKVGRVPVKPRLVLGWAFIPS